MTFVYLPFETSTSPDSNLLSRLLLKVSLSASLPIFQRTCLSLFQSLASGEFRGAKLGAFPETAKTFLKFFSRRLPESSALRRLCLETGCKVRRFSRDRQKLFEVFFVPVVPDLPTCLSNPSDRRLSAPVPCPVLSESDCKGRGFFVTCNTLPPKSFNTSLPTPLIALSLSGLPT